VNTARTLQDYKFDVCVNPFGIVYNPVSLFKLIDLALSEGDLCEDGFLENQGTVRHYDLHSELSASSTRYLQDKFANARRGAAEYIQSSQYIIMTFGTAAVFRLNTMGGIVANCHKMPEALFSRHFLNSEDIFEIFGDIYRRLKRINPDLKIILTLSPVRHTRDTLQGNQLSKSILRVAIGRIEQTFEQVVYFPSYEIMMDDLRDYRFYTEDLTHPNEMALKYIWDKFSDTFFSIETKKFIEEWSKIRKALSHKPFNPKSREHLDFIEKTIERLKQFKSKVNVESEIAQMENQLK